MSKHFYPGTAQDQKGQVLVEYILMLLLVISMIAMIATTFRRSVRGLWLLFTREIAAACPKCPPPQ